MEGLDAGALFVLKSTGSWVHCGYHLTASIVAPSLLSLSYAFTFLEGTAGILCLVLGCIVLSIHTPWVDITWVQFNLWCVMYGADVANILLGGQCLKTIYLLSHPDGSMKLFTHSGNSTNAPKKDYSVKGDTEDRLFRVFDAIAIIATTFGNGIIREIQATLAPPVKGKMFKGLCICYAGFHTPGLCPACGLL